MPGWASIVLVTTFLGGCQLLFLGLIGEYIATIFDEIKHRPVYIVARAPAAAPPTGTDGGIGRPPRPAWCAAPTDLGAAPRRPAALHGLRLRHRRRRSAPIDAGALYGEEYFRGAEYLDYAADEAFIKRTLQSASRRGAGTPPRAAACSRSARRTASSSTWRAPTSTSSASRSAPPPPRHARERLGLDVRIDDFVAASPASIGAPVDATVMLDVIEHLEHPDRVIAHVAEVSRPGALLLDHHRRHRQLGRPPPRPPVAAHPPAHPSALLLPRHADPPAGAPRLPGARRARRARSCAACARRSTRSSPCAWAAPRSTNASERLVPPTLGFPLNTFDIMQVIAEYAPAGS